MKSIARHFVRALAVAGCKLLFVGSMKRDFRCPLLLGCVGGARVFRALQIRRWSVRAFLRPFSPVEDTQRCFLCAPRSVPLQSSRIRSYSYLVRAYISTLNDLLFECSIARKKKIFSPEVEPMGPRSGRLYSGSQQSSPSSEVVGEKIALRGCEASTHWGAPWS